MSSISSTCWIGTDSLIALKSKAYATVFSSRTTVLSVPLVYFVDVDWGKSRTNPRSSDQFPHNRRDSDAIGETGHGLEQHKGAAPTVSFLHDVVHDVLRVLRTHHNVEDQHSGLYAVVLFVGSALDHLSIAEKLRQIRGLVEIGPRPRLVAPVVFDGEDAEFWARVLDTKQAVRDKAT